MNASDIVIPTGVSDIGEQRSDLKPVLRTMHYLLGWCCVLACSFGYFQIEAQADTTAGQGVADEALVSTGLVLRVISQSGEPLPDDFLARHGVSLRSLAYIVVSATDDSRVAVTLDELLTLSESPENGIVTHCANVIARSITAIKDGTVVGIEVLRTDTLAAQTQRACPLWATQCPPKQCVVLPGNPHFSYRGTCGVDPYLPALCACIRTRPSTGGSGAATRQ